MEGNRGSSQRCDLLRKIREFTRAIVQDLSIGRSPIVLIDPFRVHCTNPHANCNFCKKTSMGPREIYITCIHLYFQISVLVCLNDIAFLNIFCLFCNPEQSVVDWAISDICILMQCSRHNLNLVSVGNGLVMGWIRFLEGGRKFDCINHPNAVRTGTDIVSVADYILVVEKESVFERLANDQFCNANRCIVITVSSSLGH
ncbi:meiotic recombination protein spo11-1 [Quercus suber]|uniref:Meiotic recombination protein spo11-1 n=1 Tax=Quercus suber TaxID=58331 RepID=A0AAW0LMT2_QUESU